MKILTASAFAVLTLLPACGKSSRVLIQNKGSDTMLEAAQAWAEEYRKIDATVGVAVVGGGSQVGISGLIDGTVDIANCSREFKPEEVEAAKKKNHEPVRHHVGYDGIAIYVHKDNPLAQITLEQVKQIYVDGGTITKWSQLGVTIPGGDDEMVLVSRQTNSGTYEYFRDDVLGKKANMRLGTRDMNGSKDVVDLVSKVKTAIGYSGMSYASSAVRMLPVVGKDGKPVGPSIDSVLDRSYPISRPLFMYTIGQPQGPVKTYLDWILSDAGQHVLMLKGYPPLRKI